MNTFRACQLQRFAVQRFERMKELRRMTSKMQRNLNITLIRSRLVPAHQRQSKGNCYLYLRCFFPFQLTSYQQLQHRHKTDNLLSIKSQFELAPKSVCVSLCQSIIGNFYFINTNKIITNQQTATDLEDIDAKLGDADESNYNTNDMVGINSTNICKNLCQSIVNDLGFIGTKNLRICDGVTIEQTLAASKSLSEIDYNDQSEILILKPNEENKDKSDEQMRLLVTPQSLTRSKSV